MSKPREEQRQNKSKQDVAIDLSELYKGKLKNDIKSYLKDMKRDYVFVRSFVATFNSALDIALKEKLSKLLIEDLSFEGVIKNSSLDVLKFEKLHEALKKEKLYDCVQALNDVLVDMDSDMLNVFKQKTYE